MKFLRSLLRPKQCLMMRDLRPPIPALERISFIYFSRQLSLLTVLAVATTVTTTVTTTVATTVATVATTAALSAVALTALLVAFAGQGVAAAEGEGGRC